MEYIIRSLKDFGFYKMANEVLADTYFPKVKQQYPEVIMIKEGLYQHFILTKEKKDHLKYLLENKRKRLVKELRGVNSALRQL